MLVDKYGRVAGTVHLAELAQMYAECDDDELKDHYRQVAAENGFDLGDVANDADETEEEAEPEPVEVELKEAEPEGPVAPPKSGAGSGREAWATYAENLGVEVTDDMTRDEIIDAFEEAYGGNDDVS